MPGFTDALGSLGGGLGGLFGYWMGGDDRDQAQQYLKDELGAYQGLDPRVSAQQMGPSAYDSIAPDQTRSDELEALRHYRDILSSGGNDAQYRAQMLDAQTQANQNAQALQQQISTSAAQRGIGGSGLALAQKMRAASAAANGMYGAGVGAAGGAGARQLAALQGYGQQAGATRRQDYGEASQRAGATDAISQFNAMMRQQAAQQTYNNQLARANGMGGAYESLSGNRSAAANKTQQVAAGVGQGVGAGVGAYMDSGEDKIKKAAQAAAMAGGGG